MNENTFEEELIFEVLDDFDDDDDGISECTEEERLRYKDSTYEIVSKVGYLIGVPKRFFGNEGQSMKQEIYDQLEQDKNARIVRHLCVVRNSIERSFKRINNEMRYEFRSFLTLPECVPQESIKQLREDGVQFYKSSNTKLTQHIIEINKIITDRINNCKSLFPLWLNWQYVKKLFIMPNGLTEHGTRAAANTFYANLDRYPYRMYINWTPKENGNILYNDKKFVTLLYDMNGSYFTDYSKVSDVGSYVKGAIYDFIEESEKLVLVVDCENSDPYKLSATLRNLDEQYTRKISSILLFDDVHTATTWRILEQFTSIPVEHVMTERVKENKSLVDVKLTARTCQEHYVNKVDSFVIVSSDSDFWGLISSLDEARFLVMIERDQCGPDLKRALANNGIFYCYIDDFYSGNTEDVKRGALFREMERYIENAVSLNINEMFEQALKATRVEMSSNEKTRFFEKYVKTIGMNFDHDGNLCLEFKAYK